jgi:hypothetical protein
MAFLSLQSNDGIMSQSEKFFQIRQPSYHSILHSLGQWFPAMNSSQVVLPYNIRSVLQNRGLQNPQRKIKQVKLSM